MGTWRVKRRPDLAFRRMDDESWVLCTRDQALHRLNETAAHLFELLEDGPTIDALAEALVSTYDITPERASSDAEAFARTLEERGLVTLERPEAAGGAP